MISILWLFACLATKAIAQECLPRSDGCYTCTTVITYDGEFTFSSMTLPTSLGGSSSSGIGPGTETRTSSPGETGGSEPTLGSTLVETTFGSMSTGLSPIPSSLTNTASPQTQDSSTLAQTSPGDITPTSFSLSEASVSSVTASSTSTPVVEPEQTFVITVNDGASRAKRAILYVAFDSNGQSILVSDIAAAALFVLDVDGNLLSAADRKFIGTTASNGAVSIQKYNEPPPVPLRVDESGGLVLGLAVESTFCAAEDGEFLVVYNDESTQGCGEFGVPVAPEAVPEDPPSPSSATESTLESSSPTAAEPTSSMTTAIVTSDTFMSSTASPVAPSSATNSRSSTSTSTRSSSSSTASLPATTFSAVPTTTHTSTAQLQTTSPAADTTSVQPSVVTSRSSSTSPPTTPVFSSASTSSQTTNPATSTSSSVSLQSTSTASSSTTSRALSSQSQSSTVSSTSSLATTTSLSGTSVAVTTSTSTLLSTTGSTSSTTRTTSVTTSSTALTTSRATTTVSSVSPTSSSSATAARSCVIGTRTVRVPPPKATRLTGKRGLAYGNITTLNFYKPPTQVSWAYTYSSTPNSTNNRGPFPPSADLPLDYYPLLFSDQVNINTWLTNAADAIENYGSDVLFSFNEPDLCPGGAGGSCMNVSRAITAWETYMQPFAACGVRLATPSVTSAPSGLIWLREFMGNATARNYTVDIINVHLYTCAYCQSYFEGYFTNIHNIFPTLPIWISEYGIEDKEWRNYYNENDTAQFLKNTLYWADSIPWIEKLAWFGNYPDQVPSHGGRLINPSGTGLNLLGQVFDKYVGQRYVGNANVNDPTWGTPNAQ